LLDDDNSKEMRGIIDAKLSSVFKDFSTKIFKFDDEEVHSFIENKYKPKCLDIFADD